MGSLGGMQTALASKMSGDIGQGERAPGYAANSTRYCWISCTMDAVSVDTPVCEVAIMDVTEIREYLLNG